MKEELKPLPTVRKWAIVMYRSQTTRYWNTDPQTKQPILYDTKQEAESERREEMSSEDYRSVRMDGWDLTVMEFIVLPSGLEMDGLFTPRT